MMEGTMPHVQMAVVVHWKVNEIGQVVHDRSKEIKPITQLVGDTGNSDSQIIAAYIIEQKEDLAKTKELLKAAEDGLLTVITTTRVPVTAPPVPADHSRGAVHFLVD